MSTQAIAGVCPDAEAVVTIEYPSIAAGGFGQMLGSLYESIPVRVFFGPKISYLFAVLTAPIGLLLYFLQKVVGRRYVLTNRHVEIQAARGERKFASVSLDDVGDAILEQHPGQVFYNAADIRLVKPTGETLLRLSGIKDAGGFRNAILRTAEARRLVAASLNRIAARV